MGSQAESLECGCVVDEMAVCVCELTFFLFFVLFICVVVVVVGAFWYCDARAGRFQGDVKQVAMPTSDFTSDATTWFPFGAKKTNSRYVFAVSLCSI